MKFNFDCATQKLNDVRSPPPGGWRRVNQIDEKNRIKIRALVEWHAQTFTNIAVASSFCKNCRDEIDNTFGPITNFDYTLMLELNRMLGKIENDAVAKEIRMPNPPELFSKVRSI